jgi:anti-sigma regulatory factor (Ser/Thr protein kinase)
MNALTYTFDVNGKDFSTCGQASESLKRTLKQLGFPPEVIRKCAISMYEGEVNMVIHAHGGKIDVSVTPTMIKIVLADSGPGIKDINEAMKEGYSTATEHVRLLGFGDGMGLPNMKKYSDRMDIATVIDVGTTVTLEIDVK